MILSYHKPNFTKGKQKVNKNSQNGNVLVYVLIAIVLFAALGFTLSRQTQNSNTKDIDAAKAELYAMEILTYSTQAKLAIDQMIFTGSRVNELDFTLPSEEGFLTEPYINKVYHPEGGGLSPANIPIKATKEISKSPAYGWYLGRFNNIEWTKNDRNDVLLTAHQISKIVCETINKKITDSKIIPVINGDLSTYIIDTSSNNDLTSEICSGCDGYVTLCVSNKSGDMYSFYSILSDK